MKTPDEIKKGLECCIPRYESNHWVTCSDECPYRSEGAFCRNVMQNNVRAYIHQLERERDAAVEDLETMGEARAYCDTCLHNNTNHKEEPCSSCMSGYLINNWQWRGVQEVE